MSEVKRRKGESFEGFLRRTKQIWKKSGKKREIRKRTNFAKKTSSNQVKKQKVSYLQKKSKEEYLQKIGRLPVEDTPYRKR